MSEALLRKSCHTKLIGFLVQVNAHSTAPLDYLTAITLRERAKETMKKAEEYHEILIKACSDEGAVGVQDSAFSPIEATYQQLITKIAHLLLILPDPAAAAAGASGGSSGGAAAGGTAASGSSGGVNVKLPTIEIPTFSGSYETWVSFKDLFIATVENNSQLTPAQKLQYLKSAVTGEAANIIKSMTITDANYTEAWQLLNDRYDNNREIVTSLISKLLFYKRLTVESSQELQAMSDCFCECIRALKVQKLPTDKWDDFLLVLAVSKLDPQTRREWAIRQTGTNLPTFKEFTTFLSNHIRGLLATGASTSQQHKHFQRQVRIHQVTQEQSLCLICNGHHQHFQCQDLISKSPTERSNVIKKLHLCFNCLGRDHQIKKCNSKRTCRKCQKRHHTLLHVDHQSLIRSESGKKNEYARSNEETVLSSNHVHHPVQVATQVILKTAVVLVKDKFGSQQQCRVFIDGGSQGEFISEAYVNRLQLQRHYSSINVNGFGAVRVGKTKGEVSLNVTSRVDCKMELNFNAHVLSKLTDFLPSAVCKAEDWHHLRGIELADPQWGIPGPIDIVIGAKYLGAIMRSSKRTGPPHTPTAFDTIFGWVVSGEAAAAEASISTHHISFTPDIDYLRKFWELEEPPTTRLLTMEEKQSEDHFKNSYSRDDTGRFVVSIPFKANKEYLGYSRNYAIKRLTQVERRLHRNPQLLQQYQDFMEEYESLGHMTLIPPEEAKEVPAKTHYLCHHFVQNEDSSTTKLRVVFDGSAQSSTGVSLNDTMLVGATLQDDLYDLLLRFRFYPVAMKADIAKMFRQFLLQEEDRELHRIVWRESPEKPIRDYRLNTVTYGTASATFLSTRCLLQLAEDIESKYPIASEAIKTQMYIDDVIGGAASPENAIQLYRELSAAVQEAGLTLRKWSTSHPEVLAEIPEDLREVDLQTFDEERNVKALGIRWNPTTDNFKFTGFKFDDDVKCFTKRVLLSNLARVFDPLGLISCITVRAKLLLQDLWRISCGWDDPAPSIVVKKWEEYRTDLQQLEELPIPRRISCDGATSYEIHAFGDASEVAYGVILYLKSITLQGITVQLVTSKTRVAPVKPVTLPKLELSAAFEVANLVDHVKRILQLDCPVFCWSDSTIALKWIAASPRRWKTFVANRVAKIQELTAVESWRHVPGSQNPADLASRGVSVSTLMDKMWWNGPDWLSQLNVPVFQVPAIVPSEDPEERKLPVLVSYTNYDTSILNRFSSLSRLKRVTSYILRFIAKLRKAKKPIHEAINDVPTPTELQQSFYFWVKFVQRESFKEEMKSLSTKCHVNSNSQLKQLCPYLDKSGILRVAGRLENAHIFEDNKHPIILPPNSHLTTLIVQHEHQQLLHAGFQHTWSTIQNKFWIIRGRNKVRHFIRSCVICRRHRATVAEQLMGNLPEPRVKQSRPFINTGLDFAGPFILKNPIGRAPKTYKGYICIFICMASKAIHLEAVSSLSTSAFMEAFRRFISRRGLCANLFSDQGSNFQGAEKEIAALFKSKESRKEITSDLSSHGVTWHFNPPSAPHHGGLWEAGVKSAKFHLKRIMGNANLTYEMFSTLLCQVEAVLNSRPLTPLSADPADFGALTPGHLLIGEHITTLPEVDVKDIPSNRLDQFQLQQQRIQHFWKRWSHEYLHTLQQRNKWRWAKENVKTGDLVLLVEETPPAKWKLERVQEVHPGKDGKVRVVTVKTATSIFKRPIVRGAWTGQYDSSTVVLKSCSGG